MRIVEVEPFVVGNPPPHFGGQYFTFVKLTTDDGIVGYGEAYAGTLAPDVVAAALVDVGERHLVGRSPFDIEHFWRSAYGRGFTVRPDLTLQGVMSALEMACWDIVGKAVEQPVYNLLGGQVNEKLRTYSYLYPNEGDTADVYTDPDAAAERAAEYVEWGFTGVKFDPVGPYTIFDGRQPSLERIELAVQMTKKIREAVGTKADILFGTHGQFPPSGAVRLASKLEPYDPLWFEEPTPPDDPNGMAKVARQTSIPIATGERLTTKIEFARYLEAGAAHILQPNLGRVGGGGDPRRQEDRFNSGGPQCPDRTASLLRADCWGCQRATGHLHSELLDSGEHSGLGWVPRRVAEDTDAVGGRLGDTSNCSRSRGRA